MFFLGFGDFFLEEIDLAADEVAIFGGGGGEFDFEALDAIFVSGDAGLEGGLQAGEFFLDDHGAACGFVLGVE